MKVLKKVKLNEDVISRRKQNDKNYKKKKRRKKTSIKRDQILNLKFKLSLWGY